MIRKLETCVSDPASFKKDVGTAPNPPDFYQVLWTCSTIFAQRWLFFLFLSLSPSLPLSLFLFRVALPTGHIFFTAGRRDMRCFLSIFFIIIIILLLLLFVIIIIIFFFVFYVSETCAHTKESCHRKVLGVCQWPAIVENCH